MRVGQPAGAVGTRGYLRLGIDKRYYFVHRIAWLLSYGAWPDEHIDHINGIPSDNRLKNLRACSPAENLRNRILPHVNMSGVKGVHWHKKNRSWSTNVGYRGKKISAGNFKSLEEATLAVMQLRDYLHGEFANHGDRHSDALSG
jgi:hypothetical protein